jgi:CheY-like chemotaxis protein
MPVFHCISTIPWGDETMIEDSVLQRVLVVDDEQIIADTLSSILGMHGYAAQAVYSGEDAVAVSKAFRPDVVISDFVLPGMNGLASSLEIHRAIPGCRLILVSGSARLHVGLPPLVRQTVKTQFAVRRKLLDRQDHFNAF